MGIALGMVAATFILFSGFFLGAWLMWAKHRLQIAKGEIRFTEGGTTKIYKVVAPNVYTGGKIRYNGYAWGNENTHSPSA